MHCGAIKNSSNHGPAYFSSTGKQLLFFCLFLQCILHLQVHVLKSKVSCHVYRYCLFCTVELYHNLKFSLFYRIVEINLTAVPKRLVLSKTGDIIYCLSSLMCYPVIFFTDGWRALVLDVRTY